MKFKLSPYCLSVRSFFEHIPWEDTPLESAETSMGIAGSSTSLTAQKWQCLSINQFFEQMAWDQRVQTFSAENNHTIAVIHPLAMPVGHFFRQFGQKASR